MKNFARFLEIALGVFFIASAAAKAMNIEGFAVSISAYGVIKAPALVQFAAYFTLLLETTIGASLVAGRTFKGLTYAIAIALTVVFTGLILFAWQVKGLEDCGCFGDYLKMTPLQSILKNIILIGLLGGSWYANRPKEGEPFIVPNWRTAAAGLGALAVVVIGLTQNGGNPSGSAPPRTPTSADAPFAKYAFESETGKIDLAEGEHLVALLSATCQHCMDSVPMLNELHNAEDLPEVVGLMLGSPQDIHDFEFLSEPEFPLFAIPSLEFMQFIGTAPPRLVHIRDGREITAWEWEDAGPAIEQIREAVSSGS